MYTLEDRYREAAISALKYRYQLLRYIYTQMYLCHIYGEVYFRPTFFDYYDDHELSKEGIVEMSFLIGRHLMVVPVITQFVDVNIDLFYYAYLPADRWMRLHDGVFISEKSDGGGFRKMNASLGAPVNVLVRGGSIVPLLDTGDRVLTTK